MLLAAGADVNTKIGGGLTCLHHFFQASDPPFELRLAEALLEAGADWYARDEYGTTPLDLAEGKDYTYCRDLLRKYGPTPLLD